MEETAVRRPGAGRTPVSFRVPAHIVEAVDRYARRHSMSKTDAFVHFVEAGLRAEESEHTNDLLARMQDDIASIKGMLMGNVASGAGVPPAACGGDASPAAEKRPASRAANGEAKGRLDLLRIRTAVRAAAELFPCIERVFLFGSYARGAATAASDIDVRVELAERARFGLGELAAFAERIEQGTGKDVDVVSARVIKNASLAAAIERDKVLLYERKA